MWGRMGGVGGEVVEGGRGVQDVKRWCVERKRGLHFTLRVQPEVFEGPGVRTCVCVCVCVCVNEARRPS